MNKQFTAVMPVSAYPFHLGHVVLYNMAEEVFGTGKVLVLVCNNSTKRYSSYDRMAFFRSHADKYNADYCEGLVADYCNERNIKFIVRGVRNARDFDYENEISNFNEQFGLRTIFFPAATGMERYSSSRIRELVKYGKIKEASVLCPMGIGDEELEKIAKELGK